MKTFKLLLATSALACGAAAQAQTYSAINSPGAITTPFNVLTFNGWDNFQTTGPINVGAEVGDNVIFTSVPVARLGASEQDLGDNGLWGARGDIGRPSNGFENTLVPTPTGDGNFIASAFVSRRGEFGFSFANPVSAVGAWFNQFQATGTTNNRMQLIAYDAEGNVLETLLFTVDTDAYGYNEGSFLGIRSSTNNIYGFGVADGTFVMDNLTYTVPVPEPSTYALFLAGMALMGIRAARRNRSN